MQNHHGFYRLEVPIPVPLKSVNCYLYKSDGGWHIIDTGYHTEEAERIWKQAFADLKIQPKDVVEIVITHFHPDHFGAAGWLQQWTKGAPVKMSSIDCKFASLFWQERSEADAFDQYAVEHGMSKDKREAIAQRTIDTMDMALPFPELSPFEEEEQFEWGDTFTAIHVPGHADGHMMFYSPNQRLALCGDALLPDISPNISYFPGMDPNPLESYMQTLNKMQQYDLHDMLPGHRKPFANGNERASELLKHHRERLSVLLDLLDRPTTANDIAWKLFHYIVDHKDALNMRFAFQETLSHLIYLEHQNLVGRMEMDRSPCLFYRKP